MNVLDPAVWAQSDLALTEVVENQDPQNGTLLSSLLDVVKKMHLCNCSKFMIFMTTFTDINTLNKFSVCNRILSQCYLPRKSTVVGW
jgi:hypothetical protein